MGYWRTGDAGVSNIIRRSDSEDVAFSCWKILHCKTKRLIIQCSFPGYWNTAQNLELRVGLIEAVQQGDAGQVQPTSVNILPSDIDHSFIGKWSSVTFHIRNYRGIEITASTMERESVGKLFRVVPW